MEDPKNYLVESIIKYFLGDDVTIPQGDYSCFIKFHCDKLKEVGDISFPTDCNIWSRYFVLPENYSIENNIFRRYPEKTKTDEITEFIEFSRDYFTFPIDNVKIYRDRCIVFLKRLPIYKFILKSVLVDNNYGKLTKPMFSRKIHVEEQEISEECSLTTYRAYVVGKVLKNLLKQTIEPENDEEPLKVHVIDLASGKKTINEKDPLTIFVKCGLVLDAKIGKMTNLKKSEYINMRRTDVRLATMHKYGLRIDNDTEFNILMDKLGSAVVTIDLLEAKYSSPVNNNQYNQNNNKGALFLLYNSARLEVLFKNFEMLTESGEYPPIPPLDEIDFDLLKGEEEWQIMFGFLFIYPNILKKSIFQLESGTCSIHTLLQFLYRVVSVFSIYYRTTKILMRNNPNLMPLIYARITFLKCLRVILNESLAYFDIEPVQFM